jgi:hypothetical protein
LSIVRRRKLSPETRARIATSPVARRPPRWRIAEDCIFYCYVIADIVGKLDIHTGAWRTTSSGRGRIQELSGKFRGVIEIIEWADLLGDARLRNHAFLHAAGLRFERHPS